MEDTTDRLVLPCWELLGEDGCRRLRELARPFSRAVAAGAFGGGLPLDEA